ncbi:uncharacterized protein Z519_01183 [Cladophialophora bantiana CBS 173.52]|uniref:Ketosynthase family 3 (KS3) domain-containing protein n=1 Tax=Cladophialophora bantiana (strain ATCC 10958 / CBS 173.52 / CDC B-1940 / NIH 8579) TaxID=1442370 RepID=A0A0D2ILD3_CLAB1|nr:uncharacterized protein Z519_01183 [Cladophialophora bantiana CBS 173.52]KIW97599.1 hypothetical protein Z519_01183 [Cladophialophora bantiana CBS 173.52]
MHCVSKLCDSVPELAFPHAGELQALVRSNFDAQVFSNDVPLRQHALKCILIDTANWNLAMTATVSQLMNCPRIWYEARENVAREIGYDDEFHHGQGVLSVSTNTDAICRPLDVYPDHAVAVSGMSCRFPGANSLDQFWELLSNGVSKLREMPSTRFSAAHLRCSSQEQKQCFWGNFVDDIDAFDNRFFKKSSREAASMDPQQRLLMEVAYETVASGGYFSMRPGVDSDRTGCYIGVCANDYNDVVASHPAIAFSSPGTLRALLSGKISHYFGWTGPSLTVDTACSSSAVAIDLACKAIVSGECSQALAGGVSLYTSQYFYRNLAAASFLSYTGASKPFDAAADGYFRGEGVGLVMLKQLSAAIRDGDMIRGVIAASAVNQNANATYITVPHSPSLVELYKRVCLKSEISAEDVSYVEAHGTGTPVGDPIEMESICHVFAGLHRPDLHFVSSLKGNIGHLEGASGVASLIKVCLMMRHGQIPIQANFRKLNPKITPLEVDHVEIPTKTQKWSQ